MQLLKHIVSQALQPLGYEIRRRDTRRTLTGALEQAKQAGLAPAVVFDVGAAWGAFTVACQAVFPDAQYVLVEPLDEFRQQLETLAQTRRNITTIMAAAAEQPGQVTIHVHPDLVGTSLYLEEDISDANGQDRRVPAVNLDGLANQVPAGTALLKLDVQGAELMVLSGATQLLTRAEYVIMEVSLFRFFDKGAVLDEVVDYMRTRGFVVYDVIGWQYRPLDDALAQLDVAFVKQQGGLRTTQVYATAKQRQEQWKTRSQP